MDFFDREAEFIQRHLAPLVKAMPQLKIVMEHITTKDAVDFVTQSGPNVAATVTAHHLLYNRNVIFNRGLNPHFYCLPILKRELHRKALVEARRLCSVLRDCLALIAFGLPASPPVLSCAFKINGVGAPLMFVLSSQLTVHLVRTCPCAGRNFRKSQILHWKRQCTPPGGCQGIKLWMRRVLYGACNCCFVCRGFRQCTQKFNRPRAANASVH